MDIPLRDDEVDAHEVVAELDEPQPRLRFNPHTPPDPSSERVREAPETAQSDPQDYTPIVILREDEIDRIAEAVVLKLLSKIDVGIEDEESSKTLYRHDIHG